MRMSFIHTLISPLLPSTYHPPLPALSFQHIAVVVERISNHLTRIDKIKASFAAQYQQITTTMNARVQGLGDKLNMGQQRLGEMHKQVTPPSRSLNIYYPH